MRQAIINRLLADATVTAVVDGRVYSRAGVAGGVSRERTPEAFTSDGEVLPSLVVVLGVRSNRSDTYRAGSSHDDVESVQTIDVWCLASTGPDPYAPIKQALIAVRKSLHGWRSPSAAPVADTTVKAWTSTKWTDTSQELHDAALDAPTMFTRFDALIREAI